jgi:uncharacterized membrane protein YraQ (UPF0718 family)
MDLLLRILHETWTVAVAAAPYILLGTALAGLMAALIDRGRLAKWLGKGDWRSVFRAALVGVPLPLCSCSVLPVAAQLRRAGASRGATSAFLVSTPESGADSIALSFGVLNPVMAIARPLAAFVAAALAGLAQNRLDAAEAAPLVPAATKPACSCCGTAAKAAAAPLRQRLLDGQRHAFGTLLPEMMHYYILGMVAAGGAMALLPEDALSRWLGGGLPGMLAVGAIGVAMYTCASSSTPIAAALMAKGMSPGTALVFLLAAPATSLASLQAVRGMLGGRGLAAYLAAIFGVAVASGVALDAAVLAFGLNMAVRLPAGAGEHNHSLLGSVAAVALIVFALVQAGRALSRRGAPGAAAATVH